MLFATITGNGKNWTVRAGATGSRWHGGFDSYRFAELFCENMGYIVWTDPDA